MNRAAQYRIESAPDSNNLTIVFDEPVADPIAAEEEIEREHGLSLTQPDGRTYDVVIGAVAHREYKEIEQGKLESLIAPGGTLADLKGMWRGRNFSQGLDVWAL